MKIKHVQIDMYTMYNKCLSHLQTRYDQLFMMILRYSWEHVNHWFQLTSYYCIIIIIISSSYIIIVTIIILFFPYFIFIDIRYYHFHEIL